VDGESVNHADKRKRTRTAEQSCVAHFECLRARAPAPAVGGAAVGDSAALRAAEALVGRPPPLGPEAPPSPFRAALQDFARLHHGSLNVEGVHRVLWDYYHLFSETAKRSLWSMEADSGPFDVFEFRCLVQRLVERYGFDFDSDSDWDLALDSDSDSDSD
jgi:hypothetical protein